MTTKSRFIRSALAIGVAAALSACGGGGSSSAPADNGGNNSGMKMSGAAVKGPLANAPVTAYRIDLAAENLQGASVGETRTNQQAAIESLTLKPVEGPFLLVITVDGETTDLSTDDGSAAMQTLKTIVTQSQLSGNQPVYATPMTTMVVELLSNKALTTENFDSELAAAQAQVATTLGFGIDPALNLFETPPLYVEGMEEADFSSVVKYRMANEALVAVATGIGGRTSTPASSDEVIAMLAEDASDGIVDGEVDGAPISGFSGTNVVDDLSQDLSVVKVPGTDTLISDMEDLLASETEQTGVEVDPPEDLDETVENPDLEADSDLDGHLDSADNCPGIANPNQEDEDADGTGDACDQDMDNDEILDHEDNCPETPNFNQADGDNDGIGDACDLDADNDEIIDAEDNCPAIPNASQLDTDSDGQGDVCDSDDDGDGVADTSDNCRLTPNTSQTDANSNGIGDACEEDTDEDGVIDDLDNAPLIPNPGQEDFDNDGVGDVADDDIDGDGLPNGQDPNDFDPDSDDDGIEDGIDPEPTNSVTTLDLTITETVASYQPGALIEANNPPYNDSMRCTIGDLVVGDSSSFSETWKLKADLDQFTLEGTDEDGSYSDSGSYDKDTRILSLSEVGDVVWENEGCDADGQQRCYYFYTQESYNWEATYHPGESPKITGTITGTETWTWNNDSQKSVCHFTLNFTAD
ncbi:thrombospondin type 3 repeat-containing protein [Alcanivorax sp.]|uniref:thrombospondin type 3 repeat-containing protein n=1 Tax=Alcanivorax sp. TaxID=1872427 RepID=UPI0025C5BDD3|nr:thrombospondin type 3 repeat-containing protein [Alcanivorax sp.]